MKEDFFQKAHKDASRNWRELRVLNEHLSFLKWAEKTHPATVNRLRQAYEKSKEGGEE